MHAIRCRRNRTLAVRGALACGRPGLRFSARRARRPGPGSGLVRRARNLRPGEPGLGLRSPGQGGRRGRCSARFAGSGGADRRVYQRDDGVIVAGEYLRWAYTPAAVAAGCRAEGGQELVVVAPGHYGACRGVQQLAGERGMVAHAAAIKFTGDAGRITMTAVTPRREHAEQRARVAGDHQGPWRGSHQHQPAHPGWALHGEIAARGRHPRRCPGRRPAGSRAGRAGRSAAVPASTDAGTTGPGRPPMPGMSNRTTSRCGSSASMNGCSSSKLAPCRCTAAAEATRGSRPAPRPGPAPDSHSPRARLRRCSRSAAGQGAQPARPPAVPCFPRLGWGSVLMGHMFPVRRTAAPAPAAEAALLHWSIGIA